MTAMKPVALFTVCQLSARIDGKPGNGPEYNLYLILMLGQSLNKIVLEKGANWIWKMVESEAVFPHYTIQTKAV